MYENGYETEMKINKNVKKKSNVIPGNLPSSVFWQYCPWHLETTKKERKNTKGYK